MIDLMFNKTAGHSSSHNEAYTAFSGKLAHCGDTPGYVWLFTKIELIENILADKEQDRVEP